MAAPCQLLTWLCTRQIWVQVQPFHVLAVSSDKLFSSSVLGLLIFLGEVSSTSKINETLYQAPGTQ